MGCIIKEEADLAVVLCDPNPLRAYCPRAFVSSVVISAHSSKGWSLEPLHDRAALGALGLDVGFLRCLLSQSPSVFTFQWAQQLVESADQLPPSLLCPARLFLRRVHRC